MKKFLTKFLGKEHVYSKKIGFHAPTTKFIYESNTLRLFDNLQYSRIAQFLDMDKTKSLLSRRINDPNNREDYFLYSILHIANQNL